MLSDIYPLFLVCVVKLDNFLMLTVSTEKILLIEGLFMKNP